MRIIYFVANSLKALASLVGVTFTAVSVAVEAPTWVTVTAAAATAVSTWYLPRNHFGEAPEQPDDLG